jgi:AhpC/TSA family
MSGVWMVAFFGLSCLVLVEAALVLGLLRRTAPILERSEAVLRSAPGSGGLLPGSQVPSFELDSVDDGKLTAMDLSGRPYVLLFVSSGCAPCRRLAEELRASRDGPTPGVEVVVVFNGAGSGTEAEDWPGVTLAYQSDGEVARAFGTTATPHAFAISRSETVVATGHPNTLERLRELADRALTAGDERTHDKNYLTIGGNR